MSSDPITPFQAACLCYVATHPAFASLGVTSDKERVPGYVSSAAFSAILTLMPDGLRPGELTAPHVTLQKHDLVPRISQIVFYTRAFGSCAIHVFRKRYPSLTLFHFFYEIISDPNSFFYFKTCRTKPGHSVIKAFSHTEICFNELPTISNTSSSSTVCAVCNLT